ncbi:hypothetical protein [Vibrio sp.]|uniref:hypothetical protein n=1 Tax=Vibrio sp. TaxID=678 RepID=UPI00311F5D92
MASKKASTSRAKGENDPRDYRMLVEKRILQCWREPGEIISLMPSQAEYHLMNDTLELNEESK